MTTTAKPICGSDLETLRRKLSSGGRAMSALDFMYELGLQRSRYSELKTLGQQPLMKPRLEILVRLLEEFPEWSIAQEEHLLQDALELMDMARPGRNHCLRDLAVLLGYEASASYPWAEGGAMLPTTRRILRLLIRGLRQAHPDDRAAFLERFEGIVHAVAESHGLTPQHLQNSGFAGYRRRRRLARAAQLDAQAQALLERE